MTPHQSAAEAHDMSGVHLPTYEELTAPREVAAGGLYNMRDLGRLPRRDGGHTRSGVFFRADDLSALTDAGVTSVLDAGVRTVIDLRRVAFTQREPNPLREVSAVRYHHVDMIGPQYRVDPATLDVEQVDDATGLPRFPVYHQFRQYSGWLVARSEAIAAIMRVLAQRDAGPTLFHCRGGKDRTGVIAALLLTLADVPELVIAADYGHTARNGLARLRDLPIDTPGLPVVRDERAYQRAFCPPELMPILLHWLRTCYGGVERYLRRHCGLTEDEIGVLRGKLAA